MSDYPIIPTKFTNLSDVADALRTEREFENLSDASDSVKLGGLLAAIDIIIERIEHQEGPK